MSWDPTGTELLLRQQDGGSEARSPLALLPERIDVPIPDGFPGQSLDKESRAKLAQVAELWIDSGPPWKQVPVVTPSLDWYTPTCSADNWEHTDVKLQIGQGIAYITLNRPSENNTLNDTIIHGLLDAVFVCHTRLDIRLVVFMAEGKMFSAGLDPNVLAYMQKGVKPPPDQGDGSKAQTPKAQATLQALCKRAAEQGAFANGKVDERQVVESMLWQTLARLPQVTVCLMQGSVMSTALILPVLVDLTIALKSVRFCLEDLKLGLVPAILMPHLCQKIGGSNARRLVLTAENLSADQALKMNLVQEVVDDIKSAHAKVAVEAERVTACGPRSVGHCKNLVNGVAGNPITEKVMFFTAKMLAIVTMGEESDVAMKCLQANKPKPWEAAPITPLF